MYRTNLTTVKCRPNAEAKQIAPVVNGKAYPSAVQVFSGLLDCGHAAVRTWLGLRSLSNCGWVDLRVSDFANWLGCDRSTIYRHLSNKIFFPQVLRVGGKVRVFLKSIAKVVDELGITSVKGLGACAEFDPKWLGRHTLSVVYGTELEVQNGQRQAYRTAIHSSKGVDREKIIDPNFAAIAYSKKEEKLRKARDERRKELGRSVVLRGFKSRSYRMFRIGFDQLVPGVTQEEIAKRLNRSTRTIRRRLSNRSRIGYGIAPLNRRRVIQTLAPDVEKRFTDYLNQYNLDFATVQYGDRLIQIGRIKIGDESVRVYRLLTNVYDFNENAFALLSARCARARTKRLLKQRKEIHNA